MRTMASQIIGVSIVCSTVCSGTDQRNIKALRYWPFVKGIHRSLVSSQTGVLTKASDAELWCFFDLRLNKRFHFMMSSWHWDLHKTADIFQTHFYERKMWYLDSNVTVISSCSPIGNRLTLIYVMAWWRPADNPLNKPMMTQFTNTYIRHQTKSQCFMFWGGGYNSSIRYFHRK